MAGLLLEYILQPRHFVGNESPWLFVLQRVDLPLVVLDLLVDVLQFLLDDISRRIKGDQFVLLLGDVALLLLLFEHLVYFYYLVFEFAVALLKFLDVLGSNYNLEYLMSYESFSFYLILCLLVWGVSRKSLPLSLCTLLLFINNYNTIATYRISMNWFVQ